MRKAPATVLAKRASFSAANGVQEIFFTFETQPLESFEKETEHLYQEYLHQLEESNVPEDSLIFSRVFLSDIANQHLRFRESELFGFLEKGATSLVQQPPCFGGNLGLLAYHIHPVNPAGFRKHRPVKATLPHSSLLVRGSSYHLLFSGGISDPREFDAETQTNSVFDEYIQLLHQSGMNLLSNTVRTWVFVRDIDNHYKKMTEARKALFQHHGLTEKTRYIASTGIEALLDQEKTLVSLDAISVGNIKHEQMVRMEALGNLCPTNAYGVTFERGTKVVFGDRAHLYISGTASINTQGEVVYPGDISRQTTRTLENIEALLKPHQASLKDMKYFIVYLRNIKEARLAEKAFKKCIPEETPVLMVEAPVCRPAWLVEIEGVAVIPAFTHFPPFY